MASFVRLGRLDPYELFASTMRESRPVMETMYYGAFTSFTRRNGLLKEALWRQCDQDYDGVFGELGLGVRLSGRTYDTSHLHAEAQIMDLQADQFASLVLCFGDDVAQRFRRAVLGGGASLYPGYGPTYHGERLTTLLRVGSNCYRHISEWDDMFTRLPYPNAAEFAPGSLERKALQNIEIIQRVFGIGVHELIRDLVSWRILCTIDGQYGTAEPSYDRFETALISAGRDIAHAAGKDALARLDTKLCERGLREAVA